VSAGGAALVARRRHPDAVLAIVLAARTRPVSPVPGLSNEEIAARIFVSQSTVKTHVARAMTKLGARDRAQFVVIAYESGLVRPGWAKTELPRGPAAGPCRKRYGGREGSAGRERKARRYSARSGNFA
jgi:Bacterial regulatory proteins, luxR family